MIITTVRYEACINTGGYENEKIGLTAQLQEGDTVEAAVEQLRERVFTNAHKKDIYEERRQAKIELRELNEKIAEMNKVWQQTAVFLKAQGLRSDPPTMPTFIRLLEAGPEETDVTEQVEVEVVDEDELRSSGSYGPIRSRR